MSVRVLLVDDHPFVRLGLRSFFDLVPGVEVVGEVGTAAGVGEAVAELEPDVVLMDLQLPDGDGTDVIATLRDTRPGLAVVALTSFDATDRIRAALRAGLAISERTARTHVSNVLRKLGLSSRTQMALWATRGER